MPAAAPSAAQGRAPAARETRLHARSARGRAARARRPRGHQPRAPRPVPCLPMSKGRQLDVVELCQDVELAMPQAALPAALKARHVARRASCSSGRCRRSWPVHRVLFFSALRPAGRPLKLAVRHVRGPGGRRVTPAAAAGPGMAAGWHGWRRLSVCRSMHAACGGGLPAPANTAGSSMLSCATRQTPKEAGLRHPPRRSSLTTTPSSHIHRPSCLPVATAPSSSSRRPRFVLLHSPGPHLAHPTCHIHSLRWSLSATAR